MEFIIITLSNLLWITYSILEGIRDSVFDVNEEYSRRKINFNNNKIIKIQRLVVLFSMSMLMFDIIGYYFIPFLIGQILMFTYFRDLSYSCTYNRFKNKKVEIKVSEKEKNSIVFGMVFQIIAYLLFF